MLNDEPIRTFHLVDETEFGPTHPRGPGDDPEDEEVAAAPIVLRDEDGAPGLSLSES